MADHAAFRPSAGYLFICPAAHSATKDLPPSPTSEAAALGTAVHDAVEIAMHAGTLAANMLPDGMIWTKRARELASICEIELRQIRTGCAEWHSEERVNIGAALAPDDPDLATICFGTADFIGWHAESRTIRLADLKTGQHVVAPLSVQLQLYAIGALAKFPDAQRVEISVVQPAVLTPQGGATRTAAVDARIIAAQRDGHARAIYDALLPNPPFLAGRHCAYCPALATCQAPWEKFVSRIIATVRDGLDPLHLTDGAISLAVVYDGLVRMFLIRAAEVELSDVPAAIRPRIETARELTKDAREFLQAAVREATRRQNAGSIIDPLILARVDRQRVWNSDVQPEDVIGQLKAAGADLDQVVPRKVQNKKDLEAIGFDPALKDRCATWPGAQRVFRELAAAGADLDAVAPRRLYGPATVEAAGFVDIARRNSRLTAGRLTSVWRESGHEPAPRETGFDGMDVSFVTFSDL